MQNCSYRLYFSMLSFLTRSVRKKDKRTYLVKPNFIGVCSSISSKKKNYKFSLYVKSKNFKIIPKRQRLRIRICRDSIRDIHPQTCKDKCAVLITPMKQVTV